MLRLKFPQIDYWDEINNRFVTVKETVMELEHSLVSIQEWESKWHKPFLSKKPKTTEETLDYIRCMALNDFDPSIYERLTKQHIDEVNEYIQSPMTATTFTNKQGTTARNGEQITAEIVYYWMVSLNIPMEYQYWHFNKLITLIRVCDVKNLFLHLSKGVCNPWIKWT